ncbi:MAG: threonylcarbamoyl-AMP synthase [Nitrososphaerota archaeon]|nr:threonylcarbamoyl-AMP synthase [Nitrososphaerota archaeon]MDG6930953.1 threonylcarbamoyl-AMP synthase [Nitrososphaerota archaeon]
MNTEIIKVDPIEPDRKSVMRAARIIRKGGIVAFPTETVYGLGADAFNEAAAGKIFEAKGRPRDNPLIVHLKGAEQLELVSLVNEEIMNVARKVWPGPVTLVLPRAHDLPDPVTSGLKTVAVRVPAHPVALALIELSGTPIAAPSANLAGKPSPTNAKHVIEDLQGRVDAIIDAGETFFGVESTIVNLAVNPPVLLRPGALGTEELEPIIGKITVPEEAHGYESEVAIAPGMKYRHYAPAKRVVLAGDRKNYLKILERSAGCGIPAAICSEEMKPAVDALGIRSIIIGRESDLYTVARGLFSSLRILDETDADFGVAQPFDERGIGLAIMNRLRKATRHTIINSPDELPHALYRQC